MWLKSRNIIKNSFNLRKRMLMKLSSIQAIQVIKFHYEVRLTLLCLQSITDNWLLLLLWVTSMWDLKKTCYETWDWLTMKFYQILLHMQYLVLMIQFPCLKNQELTNNKCYNTFSIFAHSAHVLWNHSPKMKYNEGCEPWSHWQFRNE